ncbi:type VI secretion system-associated protein TagO [Halomonas colorata]|uniref:type VI secretion system-associated protein TagO n=1 Tax=Halomonas colorata TaxID=2742615 RepID=UPI0018660729|nr:type VI secretion system-associated protein TagO [Halomonas colorata]
MDGLKVIATIVAGVFIIGWFTKDNDSPSDSRTSEPSAASLAVAEEAPPPTTADPEPQEDATPAPPPKPRSPWRVREETSPMDDSKSVFLSTKSNERIPGRYGSPSGNATLYVRCVENTTALVLQMNGNHMTSSQYHDWGHVQMRIDDKQAFTKSMNASTNHQSLGLWRGGQSIPVIQRMFDAELLTMRATPYSESPITMTFDISQLKDEIAPLREACHW